MCGIVGYCGPRKVVPVILEGLKRLEYRGYDSAGIAVVTPELHVFKKQGKVADLEAHIGNKQALHDRIQALPGAHRKGDLCIRVGYEFAVGVEEPEGDRLKRGGEGNALEARVFTRLARLDLQAVDLC